MDKTICDMNRIVKFRGKRIDNGAWETGCAVVLRQGLRGEEWFISDKMTGYHTSVRRSTVGQFTGLHDKNGKEIYEGDIVKTPLLDPIFGDVLSDAFDNVAISFHNGSFVVSYYNGRHNIYLQDLYDEVEVVGNIHDNPKLLK